MNSIRLVDLASRAGVTTGAIQHQFGNGNGVKIAILNSIFDRLSTQAMLADFSGDIDERIDKLRRLLISPGTISLYRVTSDILTGCRDDEELRSLVSSRAKAQDELYKKWWMRFTADLAGPIKERMSIGQAVKSSIYGICIEASHHEDPDEFFRSTVTVMLGMAVVSLDRLRPG